ncbi:lipopolysaccharide core heptose(II)-phosphate phosphatase [Escherichia coli OX25:H6]
MQFRRKKTITYFLILTLTTLLFICFLRTPTTINMKQAREISQQYQTIFLIRHGERCDRSKNACFSSNKGITVNGAIKARDYGEIFSNIFPSFCLFSTDTIRTMQTASFFSGGKAASRVALAAICGPDAAKNILKLSSDNKTTVIFTHNHCLTQIAKEMKWWKLKPEYLETLVLHIENNHLILDGKLTHDKT